MTIPSPYNFVPVSEQVFLPGWAAQVSQDVPFSDGMSGWFDIEIEATTPIYVRNGGDHPKRDPQRPLDWLNNPEVQSFFKLPDGRFAIPGTSLKGVIRSVLEIASFGKFAPVDRKRYGVRDLKNPDPSLYREHLTGGDPQQGYKPKAEPGWLEQRADGSWQIIPCEMARVEQHLLESLCPQLSLGQKQPASKKYGAWLNHAKTLCVTATIAPEACHKKHSQPMRYREASALEPNLVGHPMRDPTLVFTGQPQQRKPQSLDRNGRRKSGGKHMEFVFFNSRPPAALTVPPTVRDDFLFIHSRPEGGDNDELADLKKRFWHQGNPMPVFYLSAAAKVTAIGLAMMFRLPYRFSPAELAARQQPHSIRHDALDLAETIFGVVETSRPLKGRVQFETLPVVPGTVPVALDRVLTILNSPKPTYYPNYLEQDVDPKTGRVRGDYRTYMDAANSPTGPQPGASLRGWKRYISRRDGFAPDPPLPPQDDNGRENLKVATSFIPLQSNARFRGRVHIHNLRPCELGAVLWALTWGNDTQLRHRLGMGKPYGFGHAKICFPASLGNAPAHEVFRWTPEPGGVPDDASWATLRAECVAAFTRTMNSWCAEWSQDDWRNTPQVQALLHLATPVNDPDRDWPHPLWYPPTPKAFAEYKGDRDNPGLALMPVPGSSHTLSNTHPGQTALRSTDLQPQAEPLPALSGQHSVCFQRETHDPKLGRELWFGLKVEKPGGGKQRFSAVLRNPQTPAASSSHNPGHQFKLWVVGIEKGAHYLLSETPPSDADGPHTSL